VPYPSRLGGPRVDVLLLGTPGEWAETARQVLASGIMAGGHPEHQNIRTSTALHLIMASAT